MFPNLTSCINRFFKNKEMYYHFKFRALTLITYLSDILNESTSSLKYMYHLIDEVENEALWLIAATHQPFNRKLLWIVVTVSWRHTCSTCVSTFSTEWIYHWNFPFWLLRTYFVKESVCAAFGGYYFHQRRFNKRACLKLLG